MQGDAKDCKVWQHDKSQRRRYLAELSNRGVWMHKEGICSLDKRGAIAVFVDVGSSSSRWFRRREGRSRVFCFPTKEMNHEERLGKSPFTGLPNVKGTVAEDARITDSPPRSEPVLEIRVRPRAGMLRCSRCGRRCRGHDQGGGVRRRGRFRAVGRAGQPVHTRCRIGTRVADERREPEDRKRFSARRVARRRKTPPIGSLNG